MNGADLEKIEKKINEQLQLLSKMPLSSEFYKNKINNDHQMGWNIYNVYEEFDRMGLFENVKDFYKQDLIFKFYDQRFHGLLCHSYPNYLITLNEICNDQLIRSADIRSKKRFPVLSWSNKNNSGSLWRSSQIIDGAGNKRLVDYDKLLSYLYKKIYNLN